MPFLLVSLEFYAFTLAFWAAMYGWGRLLTFRADPGLGFSLTTVFGLGGVCVLGGIKIVRDIRRATVAFQDLLREKEREGLLQVVYQDATVKIFRIQR